jgi:protein MpaA
VQDWLLLQWVTFKHFATPKHLLLIGGGALIVVTVGLAASFFWPRSVVLSYAENNCFTQPVLLPNMISKKESQRYEATPVASFSLFGYPLYARTTCVTPTEPPKEHTSEVIPFGTAFIKKNITVSAGSFPALASQAALEAPIPTRDPLLLKLDSADRLFEYRLLINGETLDCAKRRNSIECDMAKLNLAQSATYDVTMERLFKGEPSGTMFQQALTTVESVRVISSGIAAEQTVFDVPSEFTLTLNRAAESMKGAKLYLQNGEAREEIPATATLDGTTITVRFDQPLARSTSFIFGIEELVAADGGFLAAPYSLPFKTSGGPKVLGVNIGSYKVSTTGSIVITFDSAVSTSQAVQNFVRLEVGGSAAAASISVSNNKITIKPTSALPRCTALTVKVLDGLQNTYGIAGGSAWQYKSRTICQNVFSIGTSVQGRNITAYSFGNGASKIIFVGTTHGDEKSSTHTLNSFVDSLEVNYGNIPAHRTIIVIPNLNPDGYAASRRTNANNVDLNRNFPANDWKQGVTMPDNSYNPNGGGSAPLSEPESRALANYVLAQNPRLVLTYHAAAGVVIPNDSGDSDALAHTYDQKSNVGYAPNSHTGSIFDYDTTGSFETWLHDSPGIPTLLIELWTSSNNEFSKNQNAMWAMVQLP